jgi:hypothetical protein
MAGAFPFFFNFKGGIVMRIIETDNFGRDYPDEQFVNLPRMTKAHAEKVTAAINEGFGEKCSRSWRVVEDNYTLQPGFEP